VADYLASLPFLSGLMGVVLHTGTAWHLRALIPRKLFNSQEHAVLLQCDTVNWKSWCADHQSLVIALQCDLCLPASGWFRERNHHNLEKQVMGSSAQLCAAFTLRTTDVIDTDYDVKK
jgi:hypothetical protein